MSEDGWQEFLGADGVEDWVVLHGGAVAAFRVGSRNRVCIAAWPDGAAPQPEANPPST